MIRSTISTRSRTSTNKPVSSSISRWRADLTDSPTSTAPPGMLHRPSPGSFPLLTNKTLSPWKTTPPTPTQGRSGYERSFMVILLKVYRSGKGCILANRPLFLFETGSNFLKRSFPQGNSLNGETSGYVHELGNFHHFSQGLWPRSLENPS